MQYNIQVPRLKHATELPIVRMLLHIITLHCIASKIPDRSLYCITSCVKLPCVYCYTGVCLF